MSDDELFDMYLEENEPILTSLRKIYSKGRADAIDECIEAIKNCYTCEIIMKLEQLKENR